MSIVHVRVVTVAEIEKLIQMPAAMIGPRKLYLNSCGGNGPKGLTLLLLRIMARVNFAFLVAFVLVALTTLVSAAKGPVISNKGKMTESRLICV